MDFILTYAITILVVVGLGAALYLVERVRTQQRIALESLRTMRLFEDSLEQRLQEVDDYRHDLAELLQQLDLEVVQRANEREDASL